MKTLITGVSSSIGIALSNRLLQAGHSVVGIDIQQPSRPPSGLEFIEANVRDIETLTTAARGCDTAIHFAINADQSRPTDILDVNVVGAYNFLFTARSGDFNKMLQETVARDFHSHGVPVMCLRFGHIVLGARAVNLDDQVSVRLR